jgi:hypothetical protein
MIRSLILCFCVATLHAQQLPGTEIYLLDLKKETTGLVLSNPRNITNHPGYDNQPYFHPDKSLLYYASEDKFGRTDIVEYNIENGSLRNITTTNDREYSPTVTPDKKFLSCIIQRESGVQDLGKYPIEGGEAQVLIDNLTVGYHAWMDDDDLFLFVLGEKNSLHRVNLREKSDQVVEQNIGRSIHRNSLGYISFIQKETSEKWVIKIIPNRIGPILQIAETLKGREDIAWTPDMKLITSDGEKFFFANTSDQQNRAPEWNEIKMEGVSLKGISRIAVNSTGTKVAVVVSE